MENTPIDVMRRKAQENGMVTLRDAGFSFIQDGTTTAEEVIRETILEA
jgi:type II secretory ATPase GspE/PulE/Tfp pilus assembly ATPase PilB-like protein